MHGWKAIRALQPSRLNLRAGLVFLRLFSQPSCRFRLAMEVFQILRYNQLCSQPASATVSLAVRRRFGTLSLCAPQKSRFGMRFLDKQRTLIASAGDVVPGRDRIDGYGSASSFLFYSRDRIGADGTARDGWVAPRTW